MNEKTTNRIENQQKPPGNRQEAPADAPRRAMRRKDRALTEEEAVQVLEKAEYGVLALVDPEGRPYGVPMSFAYVDGSVWMHGTAAESLKKACLAADPQACFTAVADTEVLPEKFSTRYWSAIVYGRAQVVDNDADKRKGLLALLEKYSPDFHKSGMEYMDKAINQVDVIRLRADQITGKARKK